ncbi:MAG TPA: saccharopine dehydrogenase [Rhodobacteraceae bacterium]|nr:saccharopine dehydrogenase [Paracoccaceae bacterium]
MAHIWVRAEQRAFERRVGLTPEGAAKLLAAGHQVTVEESEPRAIGIAGFAGVGCTIAAGQSWVDAPRDTIVFGLKELDEDGPDLRHKHIMFGHAFKGQMDGPCLIKRFKRGGGTLYDLEYLIDENGSRVAAFGYWAGFAGAAVGVMAMAAQELCKPLGSIGVYPSKDILLHALANLNLEAAKTAIIIGAKGRVGKGARDLLEGVGFDTTLWDINETKHGGPFPKILDHTLFVNCIISGPSAPVFVSQSSITADRQLRVIADVSCDPNSNFNPIPIYDRSTTFSDPLVRVAGGSNPLDVMAIDNLPSMLPVESSKDYAQQLLPYLLSLDEIGEGVWGRASKIFEHHLKQI